MLKTLDLFSGVGGNSLGLVRYTKTIAYCESDPHAVAVLKSRMRDGLLTEAPVFRDIKALSGEELPDRPDILVGGFPCQGQSVAGKGRGISGDHRSALFFEIMRLTDEIRPKFVFLENVPAIRTRGLDIVLQELTKRGYDCRWTMLSAAQVGAPHKRERWFLLATESRGSSAHSDCHGVGHGEQEQQGLPLSTHSEGASHQRQDSALAHPQDGGGERDLRVLSIKNGQVHESEEQQDLCHEPLHAGKDAPPVANCNESRLEVEESFPSNVGMQQPPIKRSSAVLANPDQRGLPEEGPSQPPAGASGEGAGGAWPTEPGLGGVVDGPSFGMDQGLPRYFGRDYWEEEPEGIPRTTQEKEQRVERIKRLGNGVVPLQARIAFERLMFGEDL